jgi:prevent-host-death family protein
MQTITAREAQTKFGRFSREAQRDTVIVTNHGQPVFLTIPVRISSTIAKLISEVAPKSAEEASAAMTAFFSELSANRPANPQLSEAQMDELIKSSTDV